MYITGISEEDYTETEPKEEKDFFETLDEQEKAIGEAAGLGDEDDMS